MPIITNLRSFELRNQLRNGDSFVGSPSEFATNFVGAVGETLQATYQIDISWYAEATPGDSWELEALAIERQVGSFIDDGFAVGQTFEYFPVWATYNSTSEAFVGEITAITLNGRRIEFTVSSGSVTPASAITTAGIQCQVNETANMPDTAILRFNILPNGQSFSNISELTQTPQSWYAANIDVVGSTTENMYPVGANQGWKTGSATIERNLANLIKNGATYEIVHTFQVTPFFTVDYLNDLQNGTTPALWQQELNYYFEIEFRDGLNNTNSAKFVRPDRPLGSSSWFNQSPGGFYSRYTIATGPTHTDTTTSDPVDSIQVDARTTTTFTITRLGVPGSPGGFNASERAIVYIAYLPELESEYQQTPTDLETNFIFDQITGVDGLPATTGTGVFKECEVSVSGGVMTVTVQTEYSSAEQVKIGAGSSYMLFVMVGDTSLSVNNADRTPLLVEVGDYTRQLFIPGLATWNNFNTLTHPRTLNTDTGAGPTETLNQWSEDGILLDFDFNIDTSANASISELTFILAAYKSDGTYFPLDEYSFNLSGAVVSGGVQQINLDATRGYILASGDQFNLVQLENGTTGAGTQQYEGTFGQKVKWQDWLFNAAVDPVFYDATQPQNNQNFKAQNYSGLNDYQIRVIAILDLTGTDANGVPGVGREIQVGSILDLYDYGVSDGSWGGTIYTLDPDTGADLNGAIRTDKDTLFRVVWTNPSTDLTRVYGIHRIQSYNSIGDDIEELSSLRSPGASGNLLAPTTGNTLLDLDVVGSDIHTECLIKASALDPNKTYNLSARVERYSIAPNFTIAYVGCDIELTNTYTGGGITNIEYEFTVNSIVVDTVNTTSTTYTWHPVGLFYGESVTIQQTITAGGTIVSSRITTVSVSTSCYFTYSSNAGAADTFSSSTTVTGTNPYWRLPDEIVRQATGVSVLGSSAGFDGTTRAVTFAPHNGFGEVTSINIGGAYVVGAVDFSNFTAATQFLGSSNPDLTALTFPVSTASVTNVSFNDCDISSADLSGFSSLSNRIRLYNNSSLSSILFPATVTGIMAELQLQSCSLTSLDISIFTNLGGIFNASDNSGLASLTYGSSSQAFTRFALNNCALMGTQDVSAYTGLGGAFEMRNNPLVTSITLPTSTQVFTAFWVDQCDLSSLDMSMLSNLGGTLRFYDNSNLATVTFPSTSQSITLIYGYRCDLSTVDLSPLTNISGEVEFFENTSLTTVTQPASTGTITDWNFSGCDLAYNDFTNITFSSAVSIALQNNSMTAAEVNQYLVDFDTILPGTGTGTINISGTNAAPDTTSGGFNGSAAVTSLQGKGYTVTTS